MNRILAVASVIVSLSITPAQLRAEPAAAPSGAAGKRAAWRNTHWGMTVAEVLAALPGEATRVAAPTATNFGTTLVEVPRVKIGRGDYRAELDFDDVGGLAFVRIIGMPVMHCESLDFDRLVDLLIQKYGTPMSDEKARRGDRDLAWNTPEALIKAFYLVLVDGGPGHSAASCGITYQPPGREGTDKI